MNNGQAMRSGVTGLMALGVLAMAALGPAAAWAADAPQTMLVQFSIKDYQAWRPVFNGASPARVKAGVTNPRIFRNADKPNQMLVLFDVASPDKGKAWMESNTVRADWAKGGVVGTPTYRFVQ
ncbi:MAG: hypothetical protein AB7F35_22260 [Acetobacteraceae bacterium]